MDEVLGDENRARVGEILQVTRCEVAVKGLEEPEERPPRGCKELTLEAGLQAVKGTGRTGRSR